MTLSQEILSKFECRNVDGGDWIPVHIAGDWIAESVLDEIAELNARRGEVQRIITFEWRPISDES